MRGLSVFDIIGPIMIGPSSSHTAGALKIARIARMLAKTKIVIVVNTTAIVVPVEAAKKLNAKIQIPKQYSRGFSKSIQEE